MRLKAVQTVVTAAHVHAVVHIHAYRCQLSLLVAHVHELSSAGFVEHIHSVVFGHYPEALAVVFGNAVRVFQVGKHAFQLVCLLHVVVHAVDAVARGGNQYLAVHTFYDVGHKRRHLLSSAVNHGYFGEPAALVALQCVGHTYIYIALTRLHDAVHAVVSQSP